MQTSKRSKRNECLSLCRKGEMIKRHKRLAFAFLLRQCPQIELNPPERISPCLLRNQGPHLQNVCTLKSTAMLKFIKTVFDMKKCLAPRQVLSRSTRFSLWQSLATCHSQVKDLDVGWCRRFLHEAHEILHEVFFSKCSVPYLRSYCFHLSIHSPNCSSSG